MAHSDPTLYSTTNLSYRLGYTQRLALLQFADLEQLKAANVDNFRKLQVLLCKDLWAEIQEVLSGTLSQPL